MGIQNVAAAFEKCFPDERNHTVTIDLGEAVEPQRLCMHLSHSGI